MDINQIYTKKVLAGKGKTKQFFRLQTVWNNNNFTITILDGSNSFKAEVTENTLYKLSNQYEKEFDEYLKEIRECLCDGDTENFNYCIKENTFTVFRIQDNFTIKIADFSVVHTDFNVTALKFIDEIMQVNDNFNRRLSELNQNIKRAVDDRNLYAEKLENFVELKKNTENDLYAKFAALLNEKKIRIQYLTEILESNKSTTSRQDLVVDKELQNRILKQPEVLSDSDTEDDIKFNPVEIKTPDKKQSFFFNDEDDPKKIDILPKRAKIDHEVKPNTENTKEVNIPIETNNLSSQTVAADISQNENLDFNTQDLFDRI